MSDLGHVLTEREIAAVTERVFRMYGEAEKEMTEKIRQYFAEFRELDEERRGWVESGEWTEEQYRIWRTVRMGNGKRFEAMRDELAERMTNANNVAMEYVNEGIPKVYALNRNFTAYRLEELTGGNVVFNIFDEGTVKRLIAEQPDVMPYYPPKRAVNRGIDLAFGKRQITATVTSGILQGKSVYGIADMLEKRIEDINRVSSVRAARTAMTAAQNGGRMDTYREAKKKGIRLKKQWMATLDNRTRDSHAAIDGETVDVEKKFSNGLMYPGDPNGAAAEVYNCRCTMIADLPDSPYEKSYTTPSGTKAEYQSYKEWLAEKQAETELENTQNESYNDIRNMPAGARRTIHIEMTEEEKAFVLKEARAIRADEGIFIFAQNQPTGFSDALGKIIIGSNVFPSNSDTINPISKMSVRAVLAHEYYGHYMHRGTPLKKNSWEDEFRASYSAAKNAPNLSDTDKTDLINAALQTASDAGVSIKYNRFIRSVLYGRL